ncbi:MAG: soluble lytic murein transglycosylase-like protein [Gammaproteobacteria bacterium]|jgi:soluble lytic murein transglycosylase-like protein
MYKAVVVWCLTCTLGAVSVGYSNAAIADIYKFVDSNGVIHLSDRPLGKGYVPIVRTWKGWQPKRTSLSKGRARYAPLIDKISRQFRLDRALVHAVVTAESAYNATAVSHAGAVGLMQLMPGTAKRYGVTNRRDPRQNVYAGVRYLRDLLVQFDDVPLALAAYNAGENAVVRYGNKIPPYKETQGYVRKVLDYYRRYRKSS